MKSKFYLFIISFLIFAGAFYFNVSSSYAAGICFSTPYSFIDHNGGNYTFYTCSSRSDITTSFNSALAFARWGYVATKDSCYLVLVNNDTHQIASYTNDRGNRFSFPSFYPSDDSVFYSDINSALSALSAFVPVPPTDYDESIGIGGKFWLLQSGGIANQMSWGAMWKFDDIRNFQLTIVGSKKTDKFDFTDNGGYWFDPFDYGVLGEQITLYLTPFDSSGNWGNTLSLSKACYFSLSDAIAQPFQGYVRKASNDVDIIGIDDTDVVTIKEKPDGTGVITSPTVITTTTVYSPVYQTTNQQSVVTYVENNFYTTNNYYETNNQINDNTTFIPDLNFDNSDDDNYVNAKNFLTSAPEKILSVFQVFAGTPFEPILNLLVVGFSVLTGAALVLVLCKILGVIP